MNRISRSTPADHARRGRGQIAGVFEPYVDAVFADMWERGEKMDDPAVIRARLDAAGLPADELIRLSQTDEVKQALMRNTEDSVARGAFGSPTFFVGDEIFFARTSARGGGGDREGGGLIPTVVEASHSPHLRRREAGLEGRGEGRPGSVNSKPLVLAAATADHPHQERDDHAADRKGHASTTRPAASSRSDATHSSGSANAVSWSPFLPSASWIEAFVNGGSRD